MWVSDLNWAQLVILLCSHCGRSYICDQLLGWGQLGGLWRLGHPCGPHLHVWQLSASWLGHLGCLKAQAGWRGVEIERDKEREWGREREKERERDSATYHQSKQVTSSAQIQDSRDRDIDSIFCWEDLCCLIVRTWTQGRTELVAICTIYYSVKSLIWTRKEAAGLRMFKLWLELVSCTWL